MNIEKIRADFPILKRKINDHQLIYLDNAATSQKPQAVIDAVSNFYTNYCANVGRGIYTLAEEATEAYEQARETVARFINSAPNEIIFTRGCTESINFVATAWGNQYIREGDELVVTELEHHSNLLPWQQIAQQHGATLKALPADPKTGLLNLENLDTLITKKTKIVAVTQSSNAIGTQVDVKKIIDVAHAAGALVLVDAAQTAPQKKLDVKKLGCDFAVFSGHKMLGPTGIGVLYVNDIVQDSLRPYQFGGGMVSEAWINEAFWQKSPGRYEAGTPPIAQAIGLGAAIDYLEKNIDWGQLWDHEAQLCSTVIEGLAKIPGVKILGPMDQLKQEGHLVGFVVEGVHPHDIAAYANTASVCIRAGNQCAQPLFRALGLEGGLRVSFYCYNTLDEAQKAVQVIVQAAKELHFK